MGVNLKMGNLRSGFNAVLLFSLMIACLHLLTLRQRMHQLERKMTSVRGGHDVVRRSLASREEPEIEPAEDVPAVEGLEEHFVAKNLEKHSEDITKEENLADNALSNPQNPEERFVDNNLNKSPNLEERISDKTLREPQYLSERLAEKTLSESQDLHNVFLVKMELEKNTTLAPKMTTTTKSPSKAVTTTTTALQKPIASTPSQLQATFQTTEPKINPHNFNFIINNPDKCGNGDVLLLILVTTTPQGQVQRETIRKTWGNESNIPGVIFKTVFAIGHTDDAATQAALVEENDKFKDIIQEDFVDSYHNLTLKTVMCWKWAFQYCPQARFIMKADDDTFVNIFSIARHLIGLHKAHVRRHVTGWVYVDTKPIRDPMSQWNKWYVKYEDYPRDSYPKYPCGFAYVISNDITKVLYETSETIKYLFLEDAFLGLCMEKLGIEPVHHGGFVPWYTHIDSCQFDWLMASHWVKAYEYMWYLWNTLTSC
uniref:Hexosyltransferase n=1 Tax=Branchiostoma floridae TaxID=7739 RepID=C3Y7X9_BRAFL|eukprot:XP_002607624.1 hypothetical protein BRAFLDRAFT_123960 [Branchiostoma floridae]